MDASTLIDQLTREINEEQPLFEALQEALQNCDPEQLFAVTTSLVPPLERACDQPMSLLGTPAILLSTRFAH